MVREKKGFPDVLATNVKEGEAVEGDLRGASPRLDRHIQSRIGEQLRSMYDELLQQPIPDRFAELLNKIDRSKPGGDRG